MKKDINLIKNIGKVKRIKRAGWIREGISDAESVADHSFRVAVMAMVLGEKLKVNTNKLIKMALIHDLAEGIKGDKIVERGKQIDQKARSQKDQEGIETLKEIFTNAENSNQFIQLQQEYLDGRTPEAIMLKQLERLEMAVQALEYEEEYGKNLSEFFENASLHIEHPYLKQVLETAKNLRPKKR